MPALGDVATTFQIATHVREWGLLFRGALRRLRQRDDDVAPGDFDARSRAYIRFEDAATASVLHVQLLANIGVPPGLAGALWTWPAAMRSSRRVLDEMNETVAALFQIALVGSQDVLAAAVAAAEAMGDVAAAFPGRRRAADRSSFTVLVDAAVDQLGSFVDAARRDLQRA
ncbi:MAG TPA: hypothetical protein VFQ85_18505 [Mycobacteriales bacterium]|nr:hypothetical protein [Mycobacteriales bacterium]